MLKNSKRNYDNKSALTLRFRDRRGTLSEWQFIIILLPNTGKSCRGVMQGGWYPDIPSSCPPEHAIWCRCWVYSDIKKINTHRSWFWDFLCRVSLTVNNSRTLRICCTPVYLSCLYFLCYNGSHCMIVQNHILPPSELFEWFLLSKQTNLNLLKGSGHCW